MHRTNDVFNVFGWKFNSWMSITICQTYLKETRSVISSDPLCKNDNVRFTTVTKKLCPIKLKMISMFTILKKNYFQMWCLYKSDLRISTVGKHIGNKNVEDYFKPRKTTTFSTLLIRWRLQGYCCKWALQSSREGPLEITLTFTLKEYDQHLWLNCILIKIHFND